MAIPWSQWASVDGVPRNRLGRPFASHNQGGRLEVFAAAAFGGPIFNIWQVAANGG
jgi:hypothetical protein